MTTASLTADSLWYRDAVIYQLHVRAFLDSNEDGIGDFAGLQTKLDYLQDLGVTAVWLLPFYPSPLKDDGYDIANYRDVHPNYGTLRDFKVFLREAHHRGLRVITELVLNHCSDQHPWFQQARRDPNSPFRDFFVWSATADKYLDARIIFKDFETSNWTWDPLAGAYFWHRFYHHQPDLNYDNPRVRRELLSTVDYWLNMGVDGLRLDAVPYLYEREDTNCENLQETHAFLKELRRHVDSQFANRMLLAEANQWPEDAVAYFGRGDECHTAFHFPVMPRLYMALQMEDRFPLIDVMQQTPPISDTCQWCVFLRNHDELTLEMVTDEERDYMYRAYAQEPQARINLGIRRRLAPLLSNNRRKIELLNGLLMSLTGTPVIYYGDELGMGDNVFLGDRNGVRTPMQWSADRNAGFSRANAQRLYLPVTIDHEYHYEAVNVETQYKNPNSLLWWMKRLIALRQQFHAFGRGSLEFLFPDNAKVLAFLRRYEHEQILVVANLSRFAQYVELNLSRFRGATPIELFGHNPFPRIGELPYLLTLGPHAFYWFSIRQPVETPTTAIPSDRPAIEALPQIEVSGPWHHVLTGKGRSRFEPVLRAFLTSQPELSNRADKVRSAKFDDVILLDEEDGATVALTIVRVVFFDAEDELHVLPLGFTTDARVLRPVTRLRVTHDGEVQDGVVYDAFGHTALNQTLFDVIQSRRRLPGRMGGKMSGWPAPESLHEPCERCAPPTVELHQELRQTCTESSATVLKTGRHKHAIIYDDRFLMNLRRRLEVGVSPDLEITSYLAQSERCVPVPTFVGAIEYLHGRKDEIPATLATLHRFVRNQGDAWHFTLDALGRFFEHVLASFTSEPPELASTPRRDLIRLVASPPPPLAEHVCTASLRAAELLGQRVAELHLALAQPSEDAKFAPEPFTQLSQRSLYQRLRSLTLRTVSSLRKHTERVPPALTDTVRQLTEHPDRIVASLSRLLSHKISARRIRCHGNLHLGKVMYTGKDFLIFDFDGLPSRPVTQRRMKRCPLLDVACLTRSFQHAVVRAESDLIAAGAATPDAHPRLERWGTFWLTWSTVALLTKYLATIGDGLLPSSPDDLALLFDVLLLERDLDELEWELSGGVKLTPLVIQNLSQRVET